MIDFIKTWANQIIVAVIIATIIEMLLPNGNNKKYIKMVIGLYVLFTIIQPITKSITGKSLEVSNFNYEKYFSKDISKEYSQDFEENNSKLIKQAYINSIQEDIKKKLDKKGYETLNCNIEILEDENKDTYGTINSIAIKIKSKSRNKKEKSQEEVEKTNNIIEVEEIDISTKNIDINTTNNVNISNNIEEKTNLSDDEKIEIIEYLAEEYSIDKTNIVIN